MSIDATSTETAHAQAQLARAHPGWTIWRSTTGRWYATRHLPITEAEGNAGCNRMAAAATPEDLAQELSEQEQRAQKAAAS